MGHRILVVDDEATIVHVLRTVLTKNGCEVRTAGSAEEALPHLDGWEPEVALLDIVLPGMNGIQLMGQIKERYPDTEVLIMTSNASSDTALQAVRGGAYEYLKKPFNVKETWTTVQRSIEKRTLGLKHQDLVREQEQRNQELSSAVALSGEAHPISDFKPFAEIVEYFLDVVAKELEVDRASLMLVNEESGLLEIAASRGFPVQEVGKVRVSLGEGIAGTVAETGEPWLVEDAAADPRVEKVNEDLSDSFISAPIVLSVPIKAEHRVLGVINVTNRSSGEPFTNEDLAFLTRLSSQLAVAIDGATRADKLQIAYEALKSAQDQLVFSERIKAVGQMAAGVVHDFNNVLAVILARTESVRMKLDHTPLDLRTVYSDLDAVLKTALQGADAIKRIQDYTRIRRDVPKAPVDLNDVVQDAIEIARPKWKEESESEGLAVEIDQELAEIPKVSGNVYELTQVVGNLIFNAVEAMPEGGRLSFKTHTDGDRVALEVSDTGVGMDEETKQRLFEPFFTTKKTGQGLGTSVIFGIISRHRGEISVDSEPGRGTTFSIRLPRLEGEVEAHPSEESADAESFLPANVLLVDDDEMVRETYEEVLMAGGHRVVSALGGDQAVTACRRQKFDLVITDLSMKGMSGLDLAKEVKRLDPELPVVLFSGATQQPEEKVREAGVDSVLAKPCMIDELLTTVQRTARKPPCAAGQRAPRNPA